MSSRGCLWAKHREVVQGQMGSIKPRWQQLGQHKLTVESWEGDQREGWRVSCL